MEVREIAHYTTFLKRRTPVLLNLVEEKGIYNMSYVDKESEQQIIELCLLCRLVLYFGGKELGSLILLSDDPLDRHYYIRDIAP